MSGLILIPSSVSFFKIFVFKFSLMGLCFFPYKVAWVALGTGLFAETSSNENESFFCCTGASSSGVPASSSSWCSYFFVRGLLLLVLHLRSFYSHCFFFFLMIIIWMIVVWIMARWMIELLFVKNLLFGKNSIRIGSYGLLICMYIFSKKIEFF